MTIEFGLISGDGHINEPTNAWKDRLPKKYQDRAPRIEHLEEGDAYIIEGSPAPINFGNNICGGRDPELCGPWKRWEDVPPGGYDPAARLEEQDIDGVFAEIMYPTPRPTMAVGAISQRDPEFHLALVQAYNDWLSEYCGHAPDRLIGPALMPNLGLEPALGELERAMKLPGLRSPYLTQWPSSGPTILPDDDRFWAVMRDMDVPLSIHISVSAGGRPQAVDADPNRTGFAARGELRHTVTPSNCIEFIYTGTFDRFPEMNVVFAECDSAWVAYVKEQLDNRFKRNFPAARPKIKEIPSYYFDHNISTTYITDDFAIKNRHEIGVSQIMWSSDYPHIGADYPNSWKNIEVSFKGVPEDEKYAILAGNAARVYKIKNGKKS